MHTHYMFQFSRGNCIIADHLCSSAEISRACFRGAENPCVQCVLALPPLSSTGPQRHYYTPTAPQPPQGPLGVKPDWNPQSLGYQP
jgi:hypothetical protein